MEVYIQCELSVFQSDLWYYHLKIPADKVALFIEERNRRIVCELGNKLSIQAALMPDGEGNYFININKEVRKKLKLEVGDAIEVVLKPDNSKYGIQVSEEFEAALEMDPEAADLFHQLTPGKQRSLIYLASKPKRSETRLKKTMVILDFLKLNEGALDFRLLNQAFKESN